MTTQSTKKASVYHLPEAEKKIGRGEYLFVSGTKRERSDSFIETQHKKYFIFLSFFPRSSNSSCDTMTDKLNVS